MKMMMTITVNDQAGSNGDPIEEDEEGTQGWSWSQSPHCPLSSLNILAIMTILLEKGGRVSKCWHNKRITVERISFFQYPSPHDIFYCLLACLGATMKHSDRRRLIFHMSLITFLTSHFCNGLLQSWKIALSHFNPVDCTDVTVYCKTRRPSTTEHWDETWLLYLESFHMSHSCTDLDHKEAFLEIIIDELS